MKTCMVCQRRAVEERKEQRAKLYISVAALLLVGAMVVRDFLTTGGLS